MTASSQLITVLCGGCARLATVLFLTLGVLAFGQTSSTGAISGRILNATSGSFLNNARVTVKGSNQEAFSNENGEYRLASVPSGTVELVVTFTGLATQTKIVNVAPGQTVRADLELTLDGERRDASSVVQLAAFTVEERELTAQGQALHEQRSAANIKNVVAMEEFGDLGITNPGHFLTYVPGVSNVYNTTGEVEGIGLRGMASSGTLVMFDGTLAASNDPASRSYNFSGTSTTNLDRVEVTKVPTPDLPANAVGGSINMISKSGFNRSTPQFRYNVFATLQAKGGQGRIPDTFSEYDGPDGKSSRSPIQPGFDLSYSLPLNPSLAFTFNAGHNARVQDREYISPTWDRVRLVQTAGTLNSVLNIFTKDIAAVGVDWKTGRSVFRARVDFTRQDAITRQNVFSYTFGAGATGGENFTDGAATGVGSIGQTLGQSINQYRRLLNARVGHTYTGDVWKFDWSVSYSEARRLFSDVDDGIFGGLNTTLSNVIVSAQGLRGINVMTIPQLTVRSRTGALVDPFDPRPFALNTASSGRMYFKNVVGVAGVNAARSFPTRFPITVKAGASVEETKRDNWTESLSWNIRPPAAVGQLAGNFDLMADDYSRRRVYNGGVKVNWLSLSKLYDLYRQHPDYFLLNEPAAYTNRVNSSKKLTETISAGYVRTDLKALENRLWVVAGVRFEHTADEGLGPLNDIRNTYLKDAAGRVVIGANGRPMQITTDPLALARLQFKERGAFSEKSYEGYYPSLNASYTVGRNFVVRAAYAKTIGRPDLSFITPGTSISDPSVAPRTITVVNTGLQPWTADNYDVTLESYELKGATASVSGFRKEMSKFFTAVRIPATQALLEQYGLPADLLTGDYEVITRENSADDAVIEGVEWSWRQSLRPFTALPSWSRSLGWFVNGTHLRLGGAGAESLSGYSTRIINWGVSYARGNFALKVNATYSNGPRNATVAASATTPAGTYTAIAPRTLVGGSVEYRLTKRFTVHLSGQNLSNALYRNMTYAPGAPAYVQPTQFRDNGIEYVVGVRGEF
jgi:iron complex outermembrane receptor protein